MARHARVERVRALEAVMWKFVVVLLLTAVAILVAQLVSDAPVIQTRVGAAMQMQTTYAYAGVRG
jgi:intracellular septation protein A